MIKKTLRVIGMHCKSCEILIKEDLKDINVKSEVNYKTGVLETEFDETKTSLELIKKTVEKIGYKLNE